MDEAPVLFYTAAIITNYIQGQGGQDEKGREAHMVLRPQGRQTWF